MELSERLKKTAFMVKYRNIADIGTDHGYVPIYLIKRNIVPFAYALDINNGPIQRATKNIAEEGLSDRIKTIQCDGMEKLAPGMIDTVIIAGMGGELIVNILKNSKVNHTIKELILSPHKASDMVRKYIIEMGWHIVDEKMLMDAGKYYNIIKAHPGEEKNPYGETEYIYGRILLREKNPVLKEYLENQYNKFSLILETMKKNNSKDIVYAEQVLKYNRKGREAYDSCKY